jgi:hypothetical protein
MASRMRVGLPFAMRVFRGKTKHVFFNQKAVFSFLPVTTPRDTLLRFEILQRTFKFLFISGSLAPCDIHVDVVPVGF